MQHHWDQIYNNTEEHRLGWYEADPAPTLDLLTQVPKWEQAQVLVTGAGTSILVDQLAEAGCRLVLNDLSAAALERLRKRLGNKAGQVTWNGQDLSDPLDASVPIVDLWIDRAVLHFLTDEAAIRTYFDNVRATLRPGGHVLLAEFPPHGAPTCAGLELHRYSLEEMSQRLGDGFVLIDHFDHLYTNPAGQPRPYLYALFRREN